jgi:hypothetical protein
MQDYLIESSYRLDLSTENYTVARKIIRCRDMEEAENLFLKHYQDKLGLTEENFDVIFIREHQE